MKRAVVVFSGGQDSTTCLAQARHQYDEVHCVTFDYGQRHRAEIDVARALALGFILISCCRRGAICKAACRRLFARL